MSGEKLKAVIVDDEHRSVMLLQNLIERTGKAEVSGITSDPLNAVKLVSGIKPDILFLDIHMPVKSGFDILSEMLEMPGLNPSVIFITAFDKNAIRAFGEAGFDYLLKPVEPARLNDILQRCMTGKSGRVENAAHLLKLLSDKNNLSG